MEPYRAEQNNLPSPLGSPHPTHNTLTGAASSFAYLSPLYAFLVTTLLLLTHVHSLTHSPLTHPPCRCVTRVRATFKRCQCCVLPRSVGCTPSQASCWGWGRQVKGGRFRCGVCYTVHDSTCCSCTNSIAPLCKSGAVSRVHECIVVYDTVNNPACRAPSTLTRSHVPCT